MNVIEKIKEMPNAPYPIYRKAFAEGGDIYFPFDITFDDLHRLAEIVEVAEKALHRLSAVGDRAAQKHWEETGSYSSFDEPNSVQVADAALKEINRLKEQTK